MAIKSYALTPERGASMDSAFIRNSDVVYRIYSDVADNANYVLLNYGGPQIGVGEAYDPQQRCVGLNIRSLGRCAAPADGSDATAWDLTASFGPWNPMELAFNGNPVSIPPSFQFEINLEPVPCLVDVDGNPIVNSAGDYYDPPVEREAAKVILRVNRNEASPSIATLLALNNVVNGAAWNGFPAKSVKFNCPAMPVVQYSQATASFYWPMEYIFDINFDTWVKQVLNRGFRQLNSAGQLVPILVNGQPLSDPVFLDSSGHAILTPDLLETTGDTPGDSSSGGYSGEAAGGGQPPKAGTSAEGSSTYPNAYDVYRTYDFSGFNMNTLFTLPSVLS
jgi:hypothetical protein